MGTDQLAPSIFKKLEKLFFIPKVKCHFARILLIIIITIKMIAIFSIEVNKNDYNESKLQVYVS